MLTNIRTLRQTDPLTEMRGRTYRPLTVTYFVFVVVNFDKNLLVHILSWLDKYLHTNALPYLHESASVHTSARNTRVEISVYPSMGHAF